MTQAYAAPARDCDAGTGAGCSLLEGRNKPENSQSAPKSQAQNQPASRGASFAKQTARLRSEADRRLLASFTQMPGWPTRPTLELAARQRRREIIQQQRRYEAALLASRTVDNREFHEAATSRENGRRDGNLDGRSPGLLAELNPKT